MHYFLSQHAKRFSHINKLSWSPKNKRDVVPPEKFLTNKNMEDFFIEIFETTGKPSVGQAQRWLNHVLATYGRPPVNKFHHQDYASVLDVLKGMSKEDDWKNHVTEGANALSKEAVKRIFEAPIHDPETKELCLVRLRNKALSILLIANGWHTSDAYRIHDNDVDDYPDYRDRDGTHHPKMVFRGRKCKEHKPVKNSVGCGCRGPHTSLNTNCFYNIIKWYKTKKEQSDKHFFEFGMHQLSKNQRQSHLTDEGQLADRRFFRTHPKCDKTNYPHRNMGTGAIQGVLEFWNKELDLSEDHLTTNQARKTFCTFGHRHTA